MALFFCTVYSEASNFAPKSKYQSRFSFASFKIHCLTNWSQCEMPQQVYLEMSCRPPVLSTSGPKYFMMIISLQFSTEILIVQALEFYVSCFFVSLGWFGEMFGSQIFPLRGCFSRFEDKLNNPALFSGSYCLNLNKSITLGYLLLFKIVISSKV